MPRNLMIQGTASHVGKSVLAAAFGCWLRDRGLRVAPFKAQNMSLNSYVTLQGEEIARSQAAQAHALGLEPSADMNPILLKPLQSGCQVVVQGKGVGVMSIHEYYAWKPHAWQAIKASYDRLAAGYDAVVLEGAGSPAEINLKANDLVNMRMAQHANAAVVLVGDIERGGVFAQLIGTWELLEPDERQRVAGFLINKFRGDRSLLDSGLAEIEKRTGKPVLGVLPFDPDVQLEEEDSLGLPAQSVGTAEIDVAVLLLPGISNFTDFAALGRAPGVGVRYVRDPADLHRPDLIILPGTRTTVVALNWLRASGLADRLIALSSQSRGPYMIGLCGGCQILGKSIHDPEGIESTTIQAEGLGLLELDTTFQHRKTLSRVTGQVTAPNSLGAGCPVIGYEVHQGTSCRGSGAVAWLTLHRQSGACVPDGAISPDGRICGTYVHGLFDDARFCRSLVATLRQKRGLAPLPDGEWLSQREFWTRKAAGLGGWLQKHCDLRLVATTLRFPGKSESIQ